MGLLRWLRSLTGAVLVLAAGVAIVEIALRVRGIVRCDSAPSAATENLPCPLATPSWQLGWELRPAAKIQLRSGNGPALMLSTNSLGFRHGEVTVPKPPGVYRIVCLGDETLLAPEIALDDTFCQQLQVRLQSHTQYPVEVVNAAVPQGCPLTEWLVLRHRVIGLQPDLVLAHVTYADLADDRDLRRFTVADREGVPLCCSHPALSKRSVVNLGVWRREFCVVDWGYRQLWKQVEDSSPRRQASTIWSSVEATAESPEYVQFLEPLQLMARFCDAGYSRCVVWTTPLPWQLSSTATSEGTARRDAGVPRNGLVSSRTPVEVLSRTLAEWKVPCLDASSAFPIGSAADALFLPDQPRWTASGHRRVAEFVASQLVQHLPGPWSSPYFGQEATPASYRQPSAGQAIAR